MSDARGERRPELRDYVAEALAYQEEHGRGLVLVDALASKWG
ncbi:hypothetical protein SAZ11_44005 [Streptomyces sp. FXJ1.4098]|nr:hypothetical protein [Streptomyces sp. FXJ1.4098]